MDFKRMKKGAICRTGVRRYRQSPVKRANHEDASNNARSTISTINYGPSQWFTFGNANLKRFREPSVLCENDPRSLVSLYKSPLNAREVCEGTCLPRVLKNN